MNDQNAFQALGIGIPTIAVLIGILLNRSQVDSLRNEIGPLRGEMVSRRNEMAARFEAATQGLLRVEQVLDARLKHLEERER